MFLKRLHFIYYESGVEITNWQLAYTLSNGRWFRNEQRAFNCRYLYTREINVQWAAGVIIRGGATWQHHSSPHYVPLHIMMRFVCRFEFWREKNDSRKSCMVAHTRLIHHIWVSKKPTINIGLWLIVVPGPQVGWLSDRYGTVHAAPQRSARELNNKHHSKS